ncbi:MAG: hypothetical protein ABIY70_19815 [Capsulimonas sp.]|uniref:hypothetical protein n=1 Tax=Capsulimonas sp. TaxID=2494211 RepID=UPI0032672C37
MRKNHNDVIFEEWFAGVCFAIAIFCGAMIVTYATHYIGSFLITLVSLPLLTSPRSQTLRNIGAGAILGVAVIFLFGVVAVWEAHP